MLSFLLFIGFACKQDKVAFEDNAPPVPDVIDIDQDGVPLGEDCADDDPLISPYKPELCDGVDNNCNGIVDEGVELTFYTDQDGDGYGDIDAPVQLCSVQPGYVVSDTDCDDARSDIYPSAPEKCDGVDNDCNDLIDNDDLNLDSSSGLTLYVDADGDGYGVTGTERVFCQMEAGLVVIAGDCDDDNSYVNPQRPEMCDGIDNDCDALVDSNDDSIEDPDILQLYRDIDGDGYGNDFDSVVSCDLLEGFVETPGDCDDSSSVTYPSASEYCDDVDNNCDGEIDENANLLSNQGSIFFADTDGDGFGDATLQERACSQQDGFVSNSSDCDDSNATMYPGAAHQESLLDCLNDSDGDGFSSIESGGLDCNDEQFFINIYIFDVYGDGLDRNCDGVDGMDEDGDLEASVSSGGLDCDDNNPNVNSADEDADGQSICDGDCDDTDASRNTLDVDGDGFSTCDDDCDDTTAFTYPNAAYLDMPDLCASDMDGDGYAPVDEGGTDCDDNNENAFVGSAFLESSELCYSDQDGDGYAPIEEGGQDCDDTQLFINPNILDMVGDGVDQNCDSVDGVDFDQDGVAATYSGGNDCDDSRAEFTYACSPVVGDLYITPDIVYADTEMQCAANLFDGDGDEIEFYYYWNLDGVPVFDVNTVISTEVGDTYQCCVNATDGFYTTEQCTDVFEVQNQPPEVLSVGLTPEKITTDDDVSVVLDYVEYDESHSVDVSYEWHVIRTNGDRVVDEDSDTLSGTLHFARGHQIYANVTLDDGYDTVTVTTDVYEVQNAKPTWPELELVGLTENGIESLAPIEGFHSLHCEQTASSTDDDGDDLEYQLVWLKDGENAGYDGFEDIPLEDLHEGDMWTCQIIVSDGIDEVISEHTLQIGSPQCVEEPIAYCGSDLIAMPWEQRSIDALCTDSTQPTQFQITSTSSGDETIPPEPVAYESSLSACTQAISLTGDATYADVKIPKIQEQCEGGGDFEVSFVGRLNGDFQIGTGFTFQWSNGVQAGFDRWIWLDSSDSSINTNVVNDEQEEVSYISTNGTATRNDRPWGDEIGSDNQWFKVSVYINTLSDTIEYQYEHPSLFSDTLTASYSIPIPDEEVPELRIHSYGYCQNGVTISSEILSIESDPPLWE